jgi:hypothetical protein
MILWYIDKKFETYFCCAEGGIDSSYERVSESIEARNDDRFMFIGLQ